LYEIVASRVDLDDIDYVVSPFFGGGSFEFHLQNAHDVILLVNDKFTPLTVFWRVLKKRADELADAVEDMRPVSKEDFVDYRTRIMSEPDSLTQASMYFVINRCSFSGATLSGGFSQEASNKRLTDNSVHTLRSMDMSRTYIHNRDYQDFLEHICTRLTPHARSRTLIFLDPPYDLGKSGDRLYGKNGDMHEGFDHVALRDTLVGLTELAELAGLRWVMTYNDNDYIRELYADYTILDVSWSYGMNASKKSSEMVILNF
jgi:DNA adenine methylase